MKLLVVAILIPFVYGECPSPPTDCNPPDVLCANEKDYTTEEECIFYTCKKVNVDFDPYARCSKTVENKCPKTCPEGQMICDGGLDNNGCPNAQTCESLPADENCPSYCPRHCGENEKYCEGRFVDGCKTDDACIPKDDKCPANCPVQCNLNEKFCPGRADENGCPKADECILKRSLMNGQSNTECPIYCPPRCNSDEVECSGGMDENGCELQAKCISKDSECPTHCPVHCTTNQLFCEGAIDENGCKGPDECIDMDENGVAKCPLNCDYDEVKCPDRKWEANYETGVCLSKSYSDCETNCAAQCIEDELFCNGGVDENGCQKPDFCQPMQTDLLGLDGNICETLCTLSCNSNEKKCQGGLDENGCRMQGECKPMSENPNCQTYCPKQCNENQKLCRGETDEFGCAMEDQCIEKMDYTYPNCTAHCPKSCGPNKVQCETEFGADGCPLPPKCLANDETALCPNSCNREHEIYCPEGQERCPDVVDSDGCYPQPMCMDIGTCPEPLAG